MQTVEKAVPMDSITLVRTKLMNRLEEEKLAVAIRDFYPKDSEEWLSADKEVKKVHDRVMELSFQLKGLTSEIASVNQSN